ncbi:MAG TPA: sulfate adenylyltransferase [bacterium]|nr:sulfate adenylyltransferase [bacterium]HPQ19970.1 sulfate adenylyltransferase [bacterium]
MSNDKIFYGYGNNRLVNCYISEKKYNSEVSIDLSYEQYLTVERIADGSMTPLKGFMNKKETNSVLENKKISSGLIWTIPIILQVSKEKIKKIEKKEIVKINYPEKHHIGYLIVNDIYQLNSEKFISSVFQTKDEKHPGVNKFLNDGEYCVSGDILLFKKYNDKLDKYCLPPIVIQKIIKDRCLKKIAGFQTRNVPHRAHEYLQRIALEVMDGLLIHPIIGWKKKGDYNPLLIIEVYKKFIDEYYPKNNVIFSCLKMNMYYAGPQEAILHAIIRKNYGCTHFIVGRDHAGVGNYYGLYDAHKIFDELKPQGIEVLKLNGPYYCKKCKTIVTDKTCGHSEKYNVEISGTKIRKMFQQRVTPPQYYMHKFVSQIILNYNSEIFIK